MPNSTTSTEPAAVAEAAIRAVLGGTLDDLTTVVHPDATNRESVAEPPDTRGRGPQAFHATGDWLRTAFSNLRWTTEQTVTERDVVVSFGSMSGR